MSDKPFIIAEMSGNHNQSLERALKIVDAAAKSGVDAVKIQTYTADTITIDKSDGEFFIADEKSLWQGQSLYSLYQKAFTPWESVSARLLILLRLTFSNQSATRFIKLRRLKISTCL